MNVFERLLPHVGDTMLGRFRLESELGRGGFGVVFKATQTSLNQTVAVKVLLPHILSNQELVDRFTREVAVARDLQHPNTIRILDFDRTDEGIPFYVMEFVTGRPLVEVIRDDGAMPEKRASRIVTQVLKSLAEAHARSVVHRDLKPANIMLCDIYGEHDHVKVLDFGIAKALTGTEAHTTKTGMLLGSPPYMSPEQARAEKDLDGRSDLYSVGLILAECLTGIPVVQVGELGQVLALHLSQEPLPFSPRVFNSPLWPVIERATQKNRHQRYRDAAEMRSHMESIDLPDGFAVAPGMMATTVQGGPHPTPSGMYGTPYPSHVSAVESSGQQPQMTPPSSGQFTPQPQSADGQSDPGRLVLPIGEGSEAKPPRKKAGVSPLLVVLLLLIGGGVAAVVALGPLGGSGDDGETATRDGSGDGADTGTDDQGDRVANVDDDAGQTDGQVALVTDDATHQVDPEDEDRVAVAAGMSLAQSSVHAGLPELHTISFAGLSDVSVDLNGVELGVTPFSIELLNVPHEVELSFERRGYRSASTTISLARTEPVEVDLRRDRRPDDDDGRADDGQGDDTTAATDDDEDGQGDDDDDNGFQIPEVTIH